MLEAIVLAAGLGRRMGGPKALLPWGGATLVQAHAVEALGAGVARVHAVVRAATAQRGLALPAGASWCVSEEDEALGPAGSIRAAVRALDARTAWVAICPVDVDPSAWGCVGLLMRGVGAREAAKPRRGERRGHPVLLRRRVLAAYEGDEAPPLREVLRAPGAQVVEVPVAEEAVLSNLDTPEALAAYLRAKRPPRR